MLIGWAVVAASFLYIAVLFVVAYWADTRGRQHLQRFWPTIYALSLAVYCTSWTFYGSVGLASQRGFEFLAIYVGPAVLFGLCVPLLLHIVRVAKANAITSTADFVGSRYGRHQGVAAVVTMISVVGSLPYIALQLKAVSGSLAVVLDGQGAITHVPHIFSGDLSVLVALALSVFAILFGTRQIDATEHQRGLIFAVAVESVVKLLAFLAVGIYVTFVMFDGPVDLMQRAAASPGFQSPFDRDVDAAPWLSLIGLSFFAAILLPRQFHVAVVEGGGERDLKRAAWLFPLYLVLINLFVVPIALAGLAVFGTNGVNADTFVISLPLASGSPAMVIVAFIGGLSAATAMVIVASVALSIMIGNEIVMPALLKARLVDPERMDIGRVVLLVRRVAIVAVVFLALIYYRYATDNQALAQIGLVSFAAIAQLAPAFFIGVFWREATARGAIAGMLAGFAIWFYTLLIPTFSGSSPFVATLLIEGPFGIGAFRPTQLFGVELDRLTHGVVWSLFFNLAVFVMVSLSRQPTSGEELQSNLFIRKPVTRQASSASQTDTRVSVGALEDTVARYLGSARTQHAFAAYAANRGLSRTDEADAHLLRQSEHMLASAIGAASARLVLTLLLGRRNVSPAAALALLDGASAAIEYNRGLLQTAIDEVGQGIVVLDADLSLVIWNRGFRDLADMPADATVTGRSIGDVLIGLARTMKPDTDDAEAFAGRAMRAFEHVGSVQRLGVKDAERTLELRAAKLPDGGLVATFTDITEQVRAADVLARTNEMLEHRVRERTEELERLNAELAAAKAKADEANIGKTRFLAAAGHDIIQPLNAARLYASSLVEQGVGPGQRRLVENMDRSLEAVEDIIGALLDISRLDAGALKPEPSNFALSDILDQTADDFRPVATDKGLDLTIVPSRLAVRSDKRLLRRLLQNLVSNAVKYTITGRILVGARRRGTSVVLEVWDTGQGIPEHQRKLIFEEFRRLDAGARVASGLGLGLSIVERIGRVLDHPIELRSEVGRGSVFSVTLPRARTVQPQRSPTPRSGVRGSDTFNGLKVLVIDNEDDILEGMSLLLSGWGAEVVTASDAEQAFKYLNDEDQPNVLICDYHLGTTNGLDAIANVRARTAPGLPSILLTADRSAEVRDAAAEADIAVLNKPVKPAALRAILSQWRARAAAE
jgi:Na+/proline symporter/CheY-like chemotaxis protein